MSLGLLNVVVNLFLPKHICEIEENTKREGTNQLSTKIILGTFCEIVKTETLGVSDIINTCI